MIEGTVTTLLGSDVNTDDIIPAPRLQQSTDRQFFAEHAFEKLDPDFRRRCAGVAASILVAGENFGCGSSREQAVYALQGNNVVCVIARSFPDIFHRNALANGLALIAVPHTDSIQPGDELLVDLARGVIVNRNLQKQEIHFQMRERDRRILEQGGMTARVRRHLTSLLG